MLLQPISSVGVCRYCGGCDMISVEEFIGNVERGRDVRVCRSENQRIIRFSDRRGNSCNEFTVSLEDYDRLMSNVMEALVLGHGSRFRVHIKMNYYGGMRAEVRSGFLIKSVSRLGLSPRHLTKLSDKITEKGEASEKA